MLGITETVLEMHYHKPLMDLFRDTFGIGGRGQLNFYKYSPQKESFVGFDQAYVRTELSAQDVFSVLEDRATNNNYQFNQNDIFMGYFLQFKVVHMMQKRNRYTPAQITSLPHCRVAIDTHRQMNTGLSQHELLFNLNQNKGAMVYYACPMVFDRSDLYSVGADLDTLKLADLDRCKNKYNDNENHFIYFNDPNADPVWCSKPIEGTQEVPKQFAEKLATRLDQLKPKESKELLRDMLTDITHLGVNEESGQFWKKILNRERIDILDLTSDALTVVRMRRG